MAVFLAHHNIPVAVMDHLSPLLQDVFPDSKIAKSFASARTKTSCILNMALQPHLESILVARMKKEPFALAIDGSNDNDVKKMNPLTVRFFDETNGHVCTQFLDMCATSGTSAGTAKAIFEVLDTALGSRGISWLNCVGISVDNTSVNVGKHNSIMSRALQKNKDIYTMGCPCHILHNTAHKAGSIFSEV